MRDFLRPLQCRRIANQHAQLRATPHPHHDRHRRRQTERARTRDNKNGHRIRNRVCQRRRRSKNEPSDRRQHRDADHSRHEPRRDLVRQRLDRRATALRLRHQVHDLRKQRIRSHFLSAHEEAAGLIHRRANHPIAHRFRHRHRLPREHRLINVAGAFDDDSVERNLLPGSNPQEVADLDPVERHILVASCRHATRRFWRKPEQCFHRLSRSPPRTLLQVFPKHREHGDHRRRLEIKSRRAAVLHLVRKQPRRDQRHHRKPIRCSNTQREQRIHVRTTMSHRVPRAAPDEVARPKHHRRSQEEFHPSPPRRRFIAGRQARNHARHRREEHRQRQRRAHPQLPREALQVFLFIIILRRRRNPLERHAANRTIARVILTHLGMHRTRVTRSRAAPRGISFQRHPAFRAVARHIRLHARAHRTKIFGRRRRLHRRVVRVMTMLVRAVTAMSMIVIHNRETITVPTE